MKFRTWNLGSAIMALFASLTLQAQEWSITFDHIPEQLVVTDVQELPSGQLYASMVSYGTNASTPVCRSWLASIGPNGALQEIAETGLDTTQSVFVSSILNLPDNGLVAVGSTWKSTFNDNYHIIALDLETPSSFTTAIDLPLAEDQTIWDMSATSDEEGNLLIAAAIRGAQDIGPRRGLLLKASLSEGILDSSLVGQGSTLRIIRHLLERADGTLQLSVNGTLDNTVFGRASIYRYNNSLESLNGYSIEPLSGTFPPPDSVISDGLYMTRLAGDTFLLSGRYGNASLLGYHPAMAKMSPNGDYLATFMPPNAYFDEYMATYQGHDMTAGGDVVFAVIENFFPGPPGPESGSAPSNIHVYRLDTMLAPICDYVLDGFRYHTYYYTTRIKATSDGGVLLMGSKRNLDTMEQPRGFIMKLGPETCYAMFTGEVEQQPTTQVFPNPGNAGFDLTLEGPAIRNAVLELYDMRGTLVQSVALSGTTARVDARNLPSGLYLYRVLDATGKLLGNGKWVRE